MYWDLFLFTFRFDKIYRAIRKAIENKFHSILGKSFTPVPSVDGKFRNVYFYNPKLKAESDIHRKEGQLINILECADSPFFVRTNCSFRKMKLSQMERMSNFKLFSLFGLTSYKMY
jgi:hypothetical protein